MSKFRFNNKATLLHINTRKEGDENNKELAIDLKFTTRASLDVLQFFGDGLVDFLFLPDGNVRFKLMDDVGFSYELKSYVLTLMDGQEHYGVTVKKFKVAAVNGGAVDLTFSISFKPTSTIVATLAEFLDEMIDVSLAPADRELEFDGGESKAEKLIDAMSALTPGSGDFDPLYNDAVLIIQNAGKASISHVQRQLRIGYNRAARLLEAMEVAGVVSPMQSDGARQVLQ